MVDILAQGASLEGEKVKQLLTTTPTTTTTAAAAAAAATTTTTTPPTTTNNPHLYHKRKYKHHLKHKHKHKHKHKECNHKLTFKSFQSIAFQCTFTTKYTIHVKGFT